MRLSSASTRGQVFDAGALERIALAAYDFEPGTLDAPWSAAFDALTFPATLPQRQIGRIEARWDGAGMRAEGQFDLEGSSSVPDDGAAVWRGAVIGRGQVGGGRVDRVAGAFVGRTGTDAQLATRLGEAAERPGTIDSGDVTALLGPEGDGYLAREWAPEQVGGFQVRFASEAPPAPVPVRLELAAAILIVDPAAPGFSLDALMRRTRRLQERLGTEGIAAAPTPGLRRRADVIAVWIAPSNWFDDTDWPGGSPAARLGDASAWLRTHGIALATA